MGRRPARAAPHRADQLFGAAPAGPDRAVYGGLLAWRFGPETEHWWPYLSFGGGFVQMDEGDAGSQNEGVFEFGAGVRRYFGPRADENTSHPRFFAGVDGELLTGTSSFGWASGEIGLAF